MIFVTVGTQLPFRRLIDTMDEFAATTREQVEAQTNEARDWPRLTSMPVMSENAITDHFKRARVIVGHAGIGTVLAARVTGTPLIVLPRRSDLGEHRNDHQTATARALQDQDGVWVAWNTADVERFLENDLETPNVGAAAPLHDSLVSAVRTFALGGT